VLQRAALQAELRSSTRRLRASSPPSRRTPDLGSLLIALRQKEPQRTRLQHILAQVDVAQRAPLPDAATLTRVELAKVGDWSGLTGGVSVRRGRFRARSWSGRSGTRPRPTGRGSSSATRNPGLFAGTVLGNVRKSGGVPDGTHRQRTSHPHVPTAASLRVPPVSGEGEMALETRRIGTACCETCRSPCYAASALQHAAVCPRGSDRAAGATTEYVRAVFHPRCWSRWRQGLGRSRGRRDLRATPTAPTPRRVVANWQPIQRNLMGASWK
jgi:hypothetical protein